MKKLTLLCAALLLCCTGFAQIEKGDIQLGGSVQFNSMDIEDINFQQFNISPRAGLFLSGTTSLGLQIDYSSTKQDVFSAQNGEVLESTSNQFIFSAYARFHKAVSENFYLYLQPAIGFGTGKAKLDGTELGDLSSFNLGVGPGLTYFLSPRFALEATWGAVSYTSTKIDGPISSETSNSFDIGLNLDNIGLGISYYIR
jgi:hypothetical protein